MLHLAISALVAVVVAAALFLLGARFLPRGEQIAPAVRDEPPWDLPPERRLTPEDIDELRLPVALRGYRFAETDVLLDRLAAELRERDEEIARLRGHAPVDTHAFAANDPYAADEVAAGDDVAAGDAAAARDAVTADEVAAADDDRR